MTLTQRSQRRELAAPTASPLVLSLHALSLLIAPAPTAATRGTFTPYVTMNYRPHSPLSFLFLALFILQVLAQPATLPFSECTAGNAIDPSLKINVSTVYGQIVTNDELGRHLNLTVIGDTGQTIIPISNDTQNRLLC